MQLTCNYIDIHTLLDKIYCHEYKHFASFFLLLMSCNAWIITQPKNYLSDDTCAKNLNWHSKYIMTIMLWPHIMEYYLDKNFVQWFHFLAFSQWYYYVVTNRKMDHICVLISMLKIFLPKFGNQTVNYLKIHMSFHKCCHLLSSRGFQLNSMGN